MLEIIHVLTYFLLMFYRARVNPVPVAEAIPLVVIKIRYVVSDFTVLSAS